MGSNPEINIEVPARMDKNYNYLDFSTIFENGVFLAFFEL
jgi:hypothetical protein